MGDINGSCGRSELPNEVIIDILCHLPVKSLIRFACVCKSWLHLVKSDPRFAIKHYITRATLSSSLMDNIDCVLNLEKSRKLCMYALTESKTFRCLKKFECAPMVVRVANTCHGIICFLLFSGPTWDHMILCNPSIQEVAVLPGPPNRPHGHVGLGYDPIRNDYKIVSILPPPRDDSVWTTGVYSLHCGHWRDLPPVDLGVCWDFDLYKSLTFNRNGRMCNWLVHRWENVSRMVGVMSFDMVEEVVELSSLPECLTCKNHNHVLLPSTRWQACLSCAPYTWSCDNNFIDIWVLHGCKKHDAHGSGTMWSRQLSVRFPEAEILVLQPLNFWINDKEMLVGVQKKTKGSDKEVYHYDLGSKQFKATRRKGFFPRRPTGYVESLISFKGLMSSHQEPQQHVGEDENNDHGYGGHYNVDAPQQEEGAESRFCFRQVGAEGVQWAYSF